MLLLCVVVHKVSTARYMRYQLKTLIQGLFGKFVEFDYKIFKYL